jgi:hypothetical protein
MLALPQAEPRHRQSVENWINGNKPLVRSESACFLEGLNDEDYVALRAHEPDTAGLEVLLETLLKAFPKIARHVRLLRCERIPAVAQLTLEPKISSSQVRPCYVHRTISG